jgi:predicted permease
MRDWLNRLLIRAKRTRTGPDVDEELHIHLELAEEDNRASGMALVEARRQARLKLGSTVSITARVADQELAALVEGWRQDFLSGCRAIKNTPIFSVTAILTLAFGIGANTAIFSLLYGLLLRSLPVEKPAELANITLTIGHPDDDFSSNTPYHMTEQFRARQHSFSDVSFWDFGTVSMTDRSGTLRLYDTQLVSGNAFQLVGVNPYLGRAIMPSDDARGTSGGSWPVVLGYNFWHDRFSADQNVIGKQVEISGMPATVVGIAPLRFEGVVPGIEMKLYLPLRFVTVMAARDIVDDPEIFYWCSAIGRLRQGVTLKAANVEAEFLRKDLLRQFVPQEFKHAPEFEKARIRVRSGRSGLRTEIGGEYFEPLLIMQGLVLVVLVLCCVNVGGLMLARVHVRQREFAIRSAIGAGRRRLIRQYLTESFVIATSGAALGGAAAWFGGPALLHFFRDPTLFEAVSVRPDGMIFWITALAAAATTLLFGTVPALRASSSDAALLLNSRGFVGLVRQKAGRIFIPVQAALSLVLVAVATLLSQSLVLICSQHKGFDVDHVTIQTPPFHHLPQKGDAKLDVYQRMVDRLEQMPGIRSAAVTWFTPMSGQQATGRFKAAGQNPSPFRSEAMAFNLVGPGYFRTIETHILEGREFAKGERSLNVCVLNRSAAIRLFPHQSALDRYVENEIAGDLQTHSVCRVIGIAEDAKFASLREPAPRTIYYPLCVQVRGDFTNLVFLMNAGSKAQAIDGYRNALAEIAPTIPLVLFVTLRDQMNAALGSQRLITMLSDLFAGLALFLSAIGLYGLLSSSVAQRTAEIGIRIALGAQRRSVLGLILSEALTLLGAGVALGAAGLFFSVRFVEKMLFGVSKFEPALLLASLALLVAVTLLAAAPPALRAASVDPMQALRRE